MTDPDRPSVSDPLILAFDTALSHCAAAVFADGLQATRTEAMTRGQAERLMPLLEEVLATQKAAWSDLDLIAVGIGPGNFTGIRIAVSAARGLGLGLGIPVMGVSMFEVLRDPSGPWAQPSEVVCLPAPRDHVYVQHFRYGRPTAVPALYDLNALPANLRFPNNTTVIGHAARAVCTAGHASDWRETEICDVAERIARRAAARFASGETAPDRPAPLYVRAADAAPPRDPAPVILL